MKVIIRQLDISAEVKADGGLSWTSNDLHDENSGRTMDGTMHVYRIGTKEALDVSLIPVSQTRARQILSTLRELPEFSVTYISPDLGERTATFYCAARNAELLAVAGYDWWKNIKFTLTEC